MLLGVFHLAIGDARDRPRAAKEALCAVSLTTNACENQNICDILPISRSGLPAHCEETERAMWNGFETDCTEAETASDFFNLNRS